MLTPMKLHPFYNPKAWGGTRLRDYYKKDVPAGEVYGESWELACLADGESSYEGKPLSHWIEQYGAALTGTAISTNPMEFPLLIKLIDARQNLSVQVHPDDAYAQKRHGEPYGKTEAWLVLDAPENASLILGIDCTVKELTESISRGELSHHLRHVPVQKGDVLYIPAGTVHAIEAGLMIYEVQQSSNRTYRLYAYDRPDTLHIEDSLQVIRPENGGHALRGCAVPEGENEREFLICEKYFALERLTAKTTMPQETDGTRFYSYTALGEGILRWDGGSIRYRNGDTILVPASQGCFSLEGGVLLKAYVPDVEAVRGEILRLGGDPALVGGLS